VSQSIVTWPKEGYHRVPYRVFHDPEIYAREQERIFRGPVWNYLGLEAEVPDPGDFRTTYVGATPVVLTRAEDGRLHAFSNRCAHRGSLVCLEASGKKRDGFTCVYHAWRFDMEGSLRSVAFRRGVRGEGGLPRDFSMADHGLEKLRVDTFAGIIFGTFSEETEPLTDWIGETVGPGLRRLMNRPLRILGYDTQIVHANWKIYGENIRDTYHGNILHTYFATFGLSRYSQENGAIIDPRGLHLHFFQKRGAEDFTEDYTETASSLRSMQKDFRLADPSILNWTDEFGDAKTVYVTTLFPPLMVQQLMHCFAMHQVIPKSPTSCETVYTFFGYADDPPELTQRRLVQANLIGAAGLVAAEDGAVCELVGNGTVGCANAASALEMGGRDLTSGGDTKISDRSLRNYWNVYRTLMAL